MTTARNSSTILFGTPLQNTTAGYTDDARYRIIEKSACRSMSASQQDVELSSERCN